MRSSVREIAKKVTLRSVVVLGMIASAFYAHKTHAQTAKDHSLVGESMAEIHDVRIDTARTVLKWHDITSNSNAISKTKVEGLPEDSLKIQVQQVIDSLHEKMISMTSKETKRNEEAREYNPWQSYDHEFLGLKTPEDVDRYIEDTEKNGDSIFYRVSKRSFENYAQYCQNTRVIDDDTLKMIRDKLEKDPQQYQAFTRDPEQFTELDYLQSKGIVTGEKLVEYRKSYNGQREDYDSFEEFLERRGFREGTEDEINILKAEFVQHANDSDWKKDLMLRRYLRSSIVNSTFQPGEYKYLQKRFATYKKEKVNYTQEYHIASTLYALLRTGTIDQWEQNKDTARQKLLNDLITDINSPSHYYEHNGKNYLPDGGSLYGQETEWLLLSLVELMKKGYPENTFCRPSPEKPYTLDELLEISIWRFTTPPEEMLWPISEDKEGLERYRHAGACEGAHNLHAIVATYTYKNDTAKVHEWLNVATEKVQELLTSYREQIPEPKNVTKEHKKILHELTHWLISFTEIPDNFSLDPEMKEIVRQGIGVIVTLVQELPPMGSADIGHTVDTLGKIPASVYEK